MSLIVDASVAVKWFAAEPDSDKAEAILGSRDDLLAPDLVLAELGNALRKKVALGLVTTRQAIDAVRRAPTFFYRLYPLPDLAARATEIAIDLQHPIYDCFYLALAERERLPLVSADTPLLAAGRVMKGIEVRGL